MHERIQRLRKQAGGDVVVTAPVDLAYLTGMPLSAGVVVATKESSLLVDGRYIEDATKRAPMPVHLGGLSDLATYVGSEVAFDASTTSVATLTEMQEHAPGVRFRPVPRLLQTVRAVKDEQELVHLRTAARLAASGFDYLSGQLREGVTEIELARALEVFWLEHGGEGLSFPPIIAFGPHSALPHHRPTNRELKAGDPVLFDFGVSLNGYQSDMTRVLFFQGVPDEIRTVYQIVHAALQAAQQACRAGVQAGALDRTARDVIEQAGYGPQFSHSLGHGVGLEVHELPVLRLGPPYGDVVLEANMVITIEPGIYFPGLGGVRLENTVVVQDDGCEVLTPSPFTP